MHHPGQHFFAGACGPFDQNAHGRLGHTLSQRQQVSFPRTRRDQTQLAELDALLLNPRDPGWGSSRQRQQQLLREAKAAGWRCRRWRNGLELCQAPQY